MMKDDPNIIVELLNRQHVIMDTLAECRIEIARELKIDPSSVCLKVVKEDGEATVRPLVNAVHLPPEHVLKVSQYVVDVSCALIREQLADIESRRA